MSVKRIVGELDLKLILHILRNPDGWSEDAIRAARLAAADMFEEYVVLCGDPEAAEPCGVMNGKSGRWVK